MPRLPVVSGEDVARALERLGFERVGQKGSHLKLRSGEPRTAIVPMHREVAEGALRSILRQAGITAEQFIAALA